jgi:hypothetical protein
MTAPDVNIRRQGGGNTVRLRQYHRRTSRRCFTAVRRCSCHRAVRCKALVYRSMPIRYRCA